MSLKSGKSFVKIESHLQIALFFSFFMVTYLKTTETCKFLICMTLPSCEVTARIKTFSPRIRTNC